MAHLELGRNLFNKIKQELFLVSKVERDAKMEGRRMTLVLQPDHKNPATAKPPEATPQRTGSSLNIPPRPSALARQSLPPRLRLRSQRSPPTAPPAPAAPRPVAAPSAAGTQ